MAGCVTGMYRPGDRARRRGLEEEAGRKRGVAVSIDRLGREAAVSHVRGIGKRDFLLSEMHGTLVCGRDLVLLATAFE